MFFPTLSTNPSGGRASIASIDARASRTAAVSLLARSSSRRLALKICRHDTIPTPRIESATAISSSVKPGGSALRRDSGANRARRETEPRPRNRGSQGLPSAPKGAPPRRHATPLLVIGLDGATLDLIHPWVAAGELPALGALLASGAWGKLRSTVPAATFPAWTSLVTGVNPGRH